MEDAENGETEEPTSNGSDGSEDGNVGGPDACDSGGAEWCGGFDEDILEYGDDVMHEEHDNMRTEMHPSEVQCQQVGGTGAASAGGRDGRSVSRWAGRAQRQPCQAAQAQEATHVACP
eukprot:352599-Chlamydomonas_euryale.AAC.2